MPGFPAFGRRMVKHRDYQELKSLPELKDGLISCHIGGTDFYFAKAEVDLH